MRLKADWTCSGFATIGFEDDVRLETNAIKVAERASQLVDTMAWLLAETQRRCGPIGVVTGPTRRHYDAVFYVVSLCASLAADYSIPGSKYVRTDCYSCTSREET